MILVSSHKDVVRNDIPLRIEDGYYVGLLDNLIGNIVTFGILHNSSICKLHKQGKLKFWFNEHEEFGLSINMPPLDKEKDIVVAVDVCAGKRYKNIDIGIENTYKFPKWVIDSLRWEGYKIKTFEWTGNPDEADEIDQWAEKDIPGCSFIIPIECPNNNWHGEAKVSIEKVQKAILILQRLLCYIS